MDVIKLAERKAPEEREGTVSRSSISLPSRYLEELDTSPGVVSRKAAFFEEAIRSASTEKHTSNVKETTGSMSLGKVEDTEVVDTCTKALDFSSDSEGSNEIENRPPEVNRQMEEDAPVSLAKQDDETVPGVVTDDTKPERINMSHDEVISTDIVAEYADERSSSQEGLAAEVGTLNETTERSFVVEDEASCLNETSRDELNVAGDGTVDEATSAPSEERNGSSIAEKEHVSAVATGDIVISDSGRKGGKVSKDPDRKATVAAARGQKKNVARGNMAGSLVRSSSTTSMAFFRHTTREEGRGSSSRPASVSKSTSFAKDSLAAHVDSRRQALKANVPKPKTKLSEAGSSSKESQLPARSHKPGKNDSSPSSDSSSKSSARRSVREFHFQSEARAEKRKEFYVKLEQRMAAREVEKNLLKAKSQEETDAELRKLRQSLMFKAKPMPMFYHESLPKRDVKKVPSTRAVSPKLGRRNSRTAEEYNSHHHHHVHPCQQVANEQTARKSPPVRASADTLVKGQARAEAKVQEEDCSLFDLQVEDEELFLC